MVEVVERDYELLTPKEVNAAVKRALRRRMVVVGGCIGTDAHTVGIDAILNIKGFAGEKGLEYYRELKVVNLGAQVSVPQLVERAVAEKADAVLVSQVVTQRDAHLLNTREMSAAFREAFPPARRPLLVVGGPRFDETMAAELGVDRVFTRGTTPGRGGQLPGAPPGHRQEGVMSAPADPPGRPRSAPQVVHRRYVSYAHAHYAGHLVDGAWGLGLFGDVATEMCIRTDGDEGLFASYADVQFRAPVRAGDVVEAAATSTRVGPPVARDGLRAAWSSRAGEASRRPATSAARVLAEPIVATTATGTVVVPASLTVGLDQHGVSSATRREPENFVTGRSPGYTALTCGFASSPLVSRVVDSGTRPAARVCRVTPGRTSVASPTDAPPGHLAKMDPVGRTWRVGCRGSDGRTRGERVDQ